MKKKIITLIKFIAITTVFYLLLVFNVFHVWEKLLPNTKDYVEINTPQSNTDLEQSYLEESGNIQPQTWHFAANSQKNLDNLCASINICDKIQFNGNFVATEKYSYIKIIDKILQFIDTNSNEDKQIEDVITNIEINKGNWERRWYADRTSIVFNLWSVQSRKEFIELSTHEIGHITDLWYIQWSSSEKDKNYTEFNKIKFAIDDLSLSFYKLSRDKETIRKATAKQKDFCSGYGMSDPFEDFAECFNLYTNHNSFFKQIAKTNTVMKKKYNFIASIFDGKYISTNSQDLTLIKNNTTRRPRDTTKLVN